MGKRSWKNRIAKDPVGTRDKMREMGLNSGIARRKKRDEKLQGAYNKSPIDKQT